jgi:DNA repair exonuclease SbcCD ATPase subunit
MIKHIYHLADIHITNNETRHIEYEEVFNNLYKVLEEDKEPKLIVLCGDLFHEKNLHQNKQSILAKDFIYNLSTFAQLVIIDGNHDYVPHNNNSSSSIDSLLLHLDVENTVHYLTKNKVYKIEGINFSLTTMDSPQVTPIGNKKPNELYVALYHGSLYKSTTNIGWVNDDEASFKAGDFKDYDIVMLGDIHKFQYLNKDKTIAYSSSLIQQNFGESIDFHGLIKWNVETKKGEFVSIPNNYVYKTFKITDVHNYIIPDIDGKKTRLKLVYKNQKREDIEKFKKEIHKKYNIINIRQEEQYDVNNTQIKDGKIMDKNILEVYNEYLKEYNLKEDINITNKISEYIKKFNMDNGHKIKNLKIKMLEFENLFTYGSNNKINFDSLEGIHIVTGANGLGKSSIVDIILFAIFNVFSRGKGKEALNIRHEKGKVKLTLELNGETYEIIRKIRGVKSEVSFLKEGKIITSDTKNTTDENIIKIFGNYQDMIMSSIILQVGQNFIDMGEKEKRTTLINILGLDIYENIFTECMREKKDTSSNKISELSKQITNTNYQEIILETKEELEEIKDILDSLELEKNSLIEEYYAIHNSIDKNILLTNKTILDSKINDLRLKIKNLDEIITKSKYNNKNIEECLDAKDKLISENEFINKKINTLYTLIIKCKKIVINPNTIIKLCTEKEQLTKYISTNRETINNICTQYEINENNCIEEIKRLENEIAQWTIDNNKKINNMHILKLLENKNIHLIKHKFDDDCSSCIFNKEIHNEIGYLKEINQIKEEINSFKNETNCEHNRKVISEIRRIIEIKNQILLQTSKLDFINEQILVEEKNIQMQKENDIVELENNKLLEEIKQKENTIIINRKECENISNYIRLLNDSSNAKKHLEISLDLMDKINSYDEELSRMNEIEEEKYELQNRSDIYKNRLYKIHITLDNFIKEEQHQNKIKNELNEQFKKIDVLDKTIQFFKNGFREYTFKNKASILEKRINNTLLNLSNYEIKIDTSDNNISFYKIMENVKNPTSKKNKSNVQNKEDIDPEVKLLNVRELCGFERVSFNIALRIALNSMNIMNKNNFIIIDESFSSADDKNINNITYLFETLKKEYDICIIISHLSEIKNLNEKKITIDYDKNTTDSKIYIE